jgi:TatD DNase family protein
VANQPAPGLVDTHCHLNFDVYDPDRSAVVERARQNGIGRILIPGVDLETSKTAIQYAQEFPEVFAAVGIHPNDGARWTEKSLSELKALAGEAKVVAIGEIGLDYYRRHTPHELQRAIFQQQLDLAAQLNLPVVIHNRDAAGDILNILQEWYTILCTGNSSLRSFPGVMHSFSGDLTFADELISMDFKLGINGPVTFRNSQALQETVRSLPVESLLMETDAPFLTPHPYRGKRNEPANVRIVAEKVAEVKQELVEKIIQVTTGEADKLFGWREMH